MKSVGGQGDKTGWFDNPCGIALSKDNKLFVCDSGNHRIQVFDTNLKFIFGFGKLGSGEGEMGRLTDLTFDPAGNLYVSDSIYHRVQVFSTNGTYLRTIGMHGLGELSCPRGNGEGEMGHTADLTFDPAGNLYVADSMYNRVQLFSTDGTYLRAFRILGCTPSKLPHLKGIHVDHDYVYVAECWNNSVSVFHTSGEVITSFGRRGSGEGEREHPTGITTDQDGFLYVCDTYNNRIQII